MGEKAFGEKHCLKSFSTTEAARPNGRSPLNPYPKVLPSLELDE
jgi:hypothetical protein